MPPPPRTVAWPRTGNECLNATSPYDGPAGRCADRLPPAEGSLQQRHTEQTKPENDDQVPLMNLPSRRRRAPEAPCPSCGGSDLLWEDEGVYGGGELLWWCADCLHQWHASDYAPPVPAPRPSAPPPSQEQRVLAQHQPPAQAQPQAQLPARAQLPAQPQSQRGTQAVPTPAPAPPLPRQPARPTLRSRSRHRRGAPDADRRPDPPRALSRRLRSVALPLRALRPRRQSHLPPDPRRCRRLRLPPYTSAPYVPFRVSSRSPWARRLSDGGAAPVAGRRRAPRAAPRGTPA